LREEHGFGTLGKEIRSKNCNMRVEKITYLRALLFVHLSKCQDSDPFREIKGVQYPRRRGGMLEWLSWGNLKEGD
jgi:hypothetical protein